MNQERTNASPVSSPAKGPGQTLRQARLDLRLAPEDVAQMLRLAPRQILALEEDDFASLPGPTYVRGYLRGYAQLLGLKPEPVIEAFNRLPVAAPKVDLTKLAPEPQVGSDHQLVRVVSIGMVVVILGLALAWWFGRAEQPAEKPIALAPTPTSGEMPAPAMESEKTTTNEPGETPSPTVAETPKIAESPKAAETKPAPVVPPAPAVAAPAATPPQVAATARPAAPTPATPPRELPLGTEQPSGPRMKLSLVTTQDSWAEVRDAKQNRLLYEMVPAGRTVVLEGAGPFSVFLGNVEGVSVELNGKRFDTTPYRRGPIARFSVGEPAGGASAGNVPQ